jgi:hypothetical protein
MLGFLIPAMFSRWVVFSAELATTCLFLDLCFADELELEFGVFGLEVLSEVELVLVSGLPWQLLLWGWRGLRELVAEGSFGVSAEEVVVSEGL